MSARLKLKKLKKEMELVETRCRMREYEARLVQCKYNRLLKNNIQQIEACAELYPCDTMRSATDCLDYNVRKVTDAIVRKYAEQLAEYVQNQLTTKYSLTKVSAFSVRLLAPAISEEHVKVDVKLSVFSTEEFSVTK